MSVDNFPASGVMIAGCLGVIGFSKASSCMMLYEESRETPV